MKHSLCVKYYERDDDREQLSGDVVQASATSFEEAESTASVRCSFLFFSLPVRRPPGREPVVVVVAVPPVL
jgi:hypothetical protein